MSPPIHKPLPTLRADLGFAASYTLQQAAVMRGGSQPRSMDDRWAVAMEDGWLIFRRSWTDFAVYGLLIEETADGAHVTQSWVSREAEQYKSTDIEEDRTRLGKIITNVLFRDDH